MAADGDLAFQICRVAGDSGPSRGETRENGNLWTQQIKTASGFVYVLRWA